MNKDKLFDVAIVGGGLAGLALAIQLSRQGYAVILMEKEKYPFHRVCGEYISMESWGFLKSLGVELEKINVPVISLLQLSAVNGKLIRQKLQQGGFGISRYLLDNTLVKLARSAGVLVLENSKVTGIKFSKERFEISFAGQNLHAKVVCGCYGKRSNMDIKWKRPFITAIKNKLNNYIGVKYHIKTNFPSDTIALHHFGNGYCGLVKIEEEKYNLCYLTTADQLRQNKGDIKAMEENILSVNPCLKKILAESEMLINNPVTISQISFEKKSQVENHVLMIGDAAGMIAPLCGNGMSMALHGSKIAAVNIHNFLQGNITRAEMENRYRKQWQQQFAQRLRMGRYFQKLSGNKWLTNVFIMLIKAFPKLLTFLIKQTHGKPF